MSRGWTPAPAIICEKPFTARELLARVGAHLEMTRIRKQAAEQEARLRAEAEASRDRVVWSARKHHRRFLHSRPGLVFHLRQCGRGETAGRRAAGN